ncbi:MAG: ParB/RepB/Spo0J family partition protein [Oscillospiraceae bacterium]|nr:ParB/RepB/Spo0J family partition protein [Oscillospiraceae bacterium]
MAAETLCQPHTAPVRQLQGETVIYIPLTDLHPFPNQPFKVRDDKAMQETVESVREYGVLTPAIVRSRESGGYEIVSGHRRKRACELAGVDTLPAIIREMDDDAAVILLVDSNIQREEILPSERAQALKMKLEAIKRQGARTDLTSTQVAEKLSVEKVGDEAGLSRDQVRRYIRLNNLSPQLKQMVDEKQLAFNTAVELSYLMPDEQARVLETIEDGQTTPSLAQAQKMKKLSQAGELNVNTLHSIMSEDKRPPTSHKPPVQSKTNAPAVKAASNPQQSPTDAAPDIAPTVPYDLGDKQYASFEESIADLKNNDKDCSCTPDLFLAEFTAFVKKFHKEINWFHISYYEEIFSAVSPVQLDYLRQQMDEICAAVDKLYNHVKGT